jgi:hypothetical protein
MAFDGWYSLPIRVSKKEAYELPTIYLIVRLREIIYSNFSVVGLDWILRCLAVPTKRPSTKQPLPC